MPIRWINAGKVSHFRSQSIYHGLGYAQTPSTPETVVMAIPENPYVCIGYFQDAAKEVDLNYCREQNWPVIRRETGGGTVFIDSGQLFVQWVCQPGFLPRKVEQRFRLFNQPLIETYKFFGIQAYHFAVNDVHVDGKKIVGTGAATIGQAEIVTGNFLFNFNTNSMAQVLNYPNDAFRQVIQQSMNDYITWINREVENPPTFDEVIHEYRRQCEKVLGCSFLEGEFTKEEVRAIEQAEEKIAQEDWLHSVKSVPSNNRLVKIHAGVWVGWIEFESHDLLLNVFAQVRNDALEFIRFYLHPGEIISWDLGQLENELNGVKLSKNLIAERMNAFFTKVNVSETIVNQWTEAVYHVKKEIIKLNGRA